MARAIPQRLCCRRSDGSTSSSSFRADRRRSSSRTWRRPSSSFRWSTSRGPARSPGAVSCRAERHPDDVTTANFSNIVVRPGKVDFDFPKPALPSVQRGVVTEWQVSKPFASEPEAVYEALPEAAGDDWMVVATDPTGLLVFDRHVLKARGLALDGDRGAPRHRRRKRRASPFQLRLQRSRERSSQRRAPLRRQCDLQLQLSAPPGTDRSRPGKSRLAAAGGA